MHVVPLSKSCKGNPTYLGTQASVTQTPKQAPPKFDTLTSMAQQSFQGWTPSTLGNRKDQLRSLHFGCKLSYAALEMCSSVTRVSERPPCSLIKRQNEGPKPGRTRSGKCHRALHLDQLGQGLQNGKHQPGQRTTRGTHFSVTKQPLCGSRVYRVSRENRSKDKTTEGSPG